MERSAVLSSDESWNLSSSVSVSRSFCRCASHLAAYAPLTWTSSIFRKVSFSNRRSSSVVALARAAKRHDLGVPFQNFQRLPRYGFHSPIAAKAHGDEEYHDQAETDR